MAYVLVALLLVYGTYTLFFADLFAMRAQKEEQIAQLHRKIAKYDPKRFEAKLKRLKERNVRLRADIDKARAKEMELRAQLQDASMRFLNQKNLTALLDDMLADSKHKGLVLEKIDINATKIPYMGKLEIQKELRVQGQGRFLELVRFMRGIEAHPMLLKIDDLHIETNGTVPKFSFVIKLYGAKP